MKHGIVAGSFDPITNGHVWLVEQALKIAYRVTVVVGVNPSKKYMFDMEERLQLVTNVLENELSEDEFERRVEIVPLEGELLVNFAKSVDADVLIRGIRNTVDFSYESEILLINRNIQPMIDTVFVVPPRELTEVSSSTVKGLVGFKGWEHSIRSYVNPIVVRALSDKASHSLKQKVDSTPTAQQQLRQWTDGPKLVVDFHNCVESDTNRYTVVQADDWEANKSGVFAYCRNNPTLTVFVKGYGSQYEEIKAGLPKHSVVMLNHWMPGT